MSCKPDQTILTIKINQNEYSSDLSIHGGSKQKRVPTHITSATCYVSKQLFISFTDTATDDPRIETNRPLTLDQLHTSPPRSHSGAPSQEHHLAPSKQQKNLAPFGTIHKDPSLDISETLPKSVPAKSAGGKSAAPLSRSRKQSISKPIIYPVARKPSVRGSSSSRTSVTSTKDSAKSVRAKPYIVPIRRLSSRSVCSGLVAARKEASTKARSDDSHSASTRTVISPIARSIEASPRVRSGSSRSASTRAAISPIARLSSSQVSARSAVSPIGKSTRQPVDRRPSVRSIQSGKKVSLKRKPSTSEYRITSRLLRKTSSKTNSVPTARTAENNAAPDVSTKKTRRPSVVSSKVRKHSTGHGKSTQVRTCQNLSVNGILSYELLIKTELIALSVRILQVFWLAAA